MNKPTQFTAVLTFSAGAAIIGGAGSQAHADSVKGDKQYDDQQLDQQLRAKCASGGAMVAANSGQRGVGAMIWRVRRRAGHG